MSKRNLDCTTCEMRNTTLFAKLPETSFHGLDFQPEVSSHAAQEVLIPQASKADAIYTIRKGIVKLESRSLDGSKRIVRLLAHGDTLGLQAWQLGEYPHDVVALTDVELCHIPLHVLEALQKQCEELNQELILRSCNESQQADMWITQFSTGSITRRMANLLLYLSELQKDSEENLVRLMSRDDMAAILGVRQESISRTITQFKQDELISSVTRELYTLDKQGLQQKAKINVG